MLCDVPNDRIISISSYLEEENYSEVRKSFVTSVILPFHYVWLPNFNTPRASSQSSMLRTHDAILSNDMLVSEDSTYHNMFDFLDLNSPQNYGRVIRQRFFHVWRLLAKVDLNSKKQVKNWLIEAHTHLPSNVANLPGSCALCPPSIAYATMLLMIASFGEYPMWVCNRLGLLSPNEKPLTSKMWADRYLNVVLDRFDDVNARVHQNINRAMDPLDLALYYLSMKCGAEKNRHKTQNETVARTFL